MTDLDDRLTTMYRSRLSAVTAGVALRLRVAWSKLWDPSDPATSLARIGLAAGVWTTAAQAVALAETTQWLQSFLAAHGADPTGLTAPAGLVGSSAQGVPVGQVTGQAPAVYFARLGAGRSRLDAARSSFAWLNNVGASEPFRVANLSTLHLATGDERFTGRVRRVTRPSACQFCANIAGDGYTSAHAGFAAHRACRCTVGPEVRPARAARKRR